MKWTSKKKKNPRLEKAPSKSSSTPNSSTCGIAAAEEPPSDDLGRTTWSSPAMSAVSTTASLHPLLADLPFEAGPPGSCVLDVEVEVETAARATAAFAPAPAS